MPVRQPLFISDQLPTRQFSLIMTRPANGFAVNVALTGQVAIDAENTIVVDTAIVPDAGSFEQIVAVSDDCFSSGCGCPVDDYIFAYHIVVADRQARSFTFVSEILWLGTEYGTVEYAIVFPIVVPASTLA